LTDPFASLEGAMVAVVSVLALIAILAIVIGAVALPTTHRVAADTSEGHELEAEDWPEEDGCDPSANAR
jgi:hypothetical protein